MDCNRIQELMSFALDGQLTEAETTEFNEHLASCDDCAQDYALYQSIQVGLNALGEEEAELPSGFHEQLMDRITGEYGPVEVLPEDSGKVVPLYQRLPRKYMNLAAVFVLVAVFALVGINNLENLQYSSEEAPMMTEETATNEATYDLAVEESAEMAASPEAEEVTVESVEERVASEPAPALMSVPDEMTEEETADQGEPAGDTAAVMVTEEAEESVTLTMDESLDVSVSVESEEVVETAVMEETETTTESSDSGLARDGDDSERTTKTIEFNGSELSAEPEDDSNMGIWMLLGGLAAALAVGIGLILKKAR